MNLSEQIAEHFTQLHFGGNWTAVNMKAVLHDITWQQATHKIDNINTIADLVFHCNYYISEVLKVFNGEKLQASDANSYLTPKITNETEWQQLVNKTLNDAHLFAEHIKKIPAEKFFEFFEDEKYGNYYRNIVGIIEHTHYHLGQIVILKKQLNI